jgi:hypothetical protein
MRTRASWTMLVPLVAALLVAQPLAALAAPDNDDRANATPVTTIPFTDIVDVTDATDEADEPAPSCAPTGMTVWYEVQLSKRTQLVVDTEGSGYDTVAAIYTPELQEIACNDDAGDLQARVGFTAERGGTYLVQIGAFGGDIDLEWEQASLVVSIDRGRAITRQVKPERFSFQGLQADAFNWWESEDGLSFGSEGVSIVDGRASDAWSRGRYRIEEVTVSRWEETIDLEKGTLTFTDWWGWAPLENGEIDRRLRDAYVDQAVWVYGYSCTGPLEWDEETEFECTELGGAEVMVAVDWIGHGSIRRANERGRFVDEWGTYTYRYRASERDAEVSGGVSGEVLSFDLSGAEGRLADVQSSDSFRQARR